MFPHVDLCNQHEERLIAWMSLQERVTSWLHGIRDPEPCPPSSFRHGSKGRKRHHHLPYPTRCERPRTNSPVKAMLESDVPTFETSPIWHVQENLDQCEHRTTSLIEFKVADDLPDPEYNPLITFFATDIEEEYRRLLLLCNKLEADKFEVDLVWKRDLSLAAMRELLDIEMSIQRVLRSAQYVIDYSHHCNLNVDFQTLFLQHRHSPYQPLPPKKPVYGIQHCGESWAYPNQAPQNQIQDVREQEISGFDCQALTSLNPEVHNLWVFE